jgi:hypothetical protein
VGIVVKISSLCPVRQGSKGIENLTVLFQMQNIPQVSVLVVSQAAEAVVQRRVGSPDNRLLIPPLSVLLLGNLL